MKTQKWIKTIGKLDSLQRLTSQWARGFVTEFTEYEPITKAQRKVGVQWIPPLHETIHGVYGGYKGQWILLEDELTNQT